MNNLGEFLSASKDEQPWSVWWLRDKQRERENIKKARAKRRAFFLFTRQIEGTWKTRRLKSGDLAA
jgi:hypothetical protein